VISATVSMLAVVTVLSTNGIPWRAAAPARISHDLGHISPCRPTGAMPNGEAYSRPKSVDFCEAPP
jgi:hypothetical protein